MKRWSQRLIAKTKQYYEELLAIHSEDDFIEEVDPDKDNEDDENEGAEMKSSNKQQGKLRVLSIKDLQVRSTMY